MVPHGGFANPVKLETSEDSNQSSTYSESSTTLGGSNYRPKSTSNNPQQTGPLDVKSNSIGGTSDQWLFPRFEPLGLKQATSPQDLSRKTNEPTNKQENDRGDTAEDLSCKVNQGQGHRQGEMDSDPNSPADLSQDGAFGDEGEGCLDETGLSMVEQNMSRNLESEMARDNRHVNKRKSSRPKWVYEGLQLDRSVSIDGQGGKDGGTGSEAVSGNSGSENGEDEDIESERDQGQEMKNRRYWENVEKEKKVESGNTEENNSKDQMYRSGNIDKLQRNLAGETEEEDWEDFE